MLNGVKHLVLSAPWLEILRDAQDDWKAKGWRRKTKGDEERQNRQRKTKKTKGDEID